MTPPSTSTKSRPAVAEALLAARRVRPVPLGSHMLGAGRVFVIAEAGVNHNGDVALARRRIAAAAATGADAVKFQTFDPAALAAVGAPTADYQRRAGVEAADQREMLSRLTLPRTPGRAAGRPRPGPGVPVHSLRRRGGGAPDRLGVPGFKVGSGELTNTPFIVRLARRGRPLLISTGMADMVEVAAAVDAVRAGGDVPLGLFHCVSSYLARRGRQSARHRDNAPGVRRTGRLVRPHPGHGAGVGGGRCRCVHHREAPTLDRTLPGPDYWGVAGTRPVRGDGCRHPRRVEAALGTGIKVLVEAERDVASVAGAACTGPGRRGRAARDGR